MRVCIPTIAYNRERIVFAFSTLLKQRFPANGGTKSTLTDRIMINLLKRVHESLYSEFKNVANIGRMKVDAFEDGVTSRDRISSEDVLFLEANGTNAENEPAVVPIKYMRALVFLEDRIKPMLLSMESIQYARLSCNSRTMEL